MPFIVPDANFEPVKMKQGIVGSGVSHIPSRLGQVGSFQRYSMRVWEVFVAYGNAFEKYAALIICRRRLMDW